MSNAIHNINESEFEAEVLQADKPVLVDFWAEWCAPCKMMGAVLHDMADEVSDKIKICKIDTDANQKLMIQFGIRGIPALLIFKNGEIQAQAAGAMNKGQLMKFIDDNI